VRKGIYILIGRGVEDISTVWDHHYFSKTLALMCPFIFYIASVACMFYVIQ